MTTDETTLIAEYVEENPHFPGAADAWLRESGVPVWAIVGYYEGGGQQDVQRVAEDYDLTVDEVRAALAYYREHAHPIKERLKSNAA